MLEDEWVGIVSVNPISKTLVVNRGILDTIPVSHSAGSFIWFHQGLFGTDPVERVAGENVEVKFLPATGLGRLPIGSASTNSILLAGRMMRPYPPGNVQINNMRWPSSIGVYPLSISWAHRDRLTQTVTLNSQSGGDIGPEAGTTYNLKIYGDSILRKSLTGLTTTSYTYSIEQEYLDLGFSGDVFAISTVLSMNMNGANDSVVFPDLYSHVVSPVGNSKISTTKNKYGGSSAYFDGSGDYLTIPASADFDLGTGDFTIEFWVNWSVLSILDLIDVDGCTIFVYTPQHSFCGYCRGAYVGSAWGTFYPVINTWYHLAAVRRGNNIYFYVDGSEITYGAYSGTFGSATAPVTLIGSRGFNGYIDDLRITKAARYSGNFTPPTEISTSLVIPPPLNSSLRIELESVRDSLTSLNKWDLTVGRA
jgi:hypothetical protein